jgi:uncharacterized protein (TIGR02594 family)
MAQPPWMAHAWAELGQQEGDGDADNPRIVALYREAGHPEARHDDIAWCAAFVGASLARAGQASTSSLLARSYLGWGSALAAGRYGAIAVFSRGSDPAAGHVAFYLDSDRERIFVLGGNQGDAVSVTAIQRDRLLGLRWPDDVEPAPADVPAPSPPNIFDVALRHVLAMEGGWTDDPYDPGGPTNFGITLATLAAHRGRVVDAVVFAELKQVLRQITQAEVREIYLQRYWLPSHAGALPPAVALMHFDAGVNHGTGTAARMLQEAAGVMIDGEIGPETRAACEALPASQLLARYAAIRRARYRALTHFWRFGRGWLARVDATLRLASTLSPRQPAGDATMTGSKDETIVNTPAQPAKWWGESLTVWGTIITAASTVIPVLGPLIGLDITGEMIRQMGSQAVQVAQALGGLAGTLMTLYGRVRATTRLERRSVTMQL